MAITIGDLRTHVEKTQLLPRHVLFFFFQLHVADGQQLGGQSLLESAEVVTVIFIILSACKKCRFDHSEGQVVVILTGSGEFLCELLVDLAHLLHVFGSIH